MVRPVRAPARQGRSRAVTLGLSPFSSSAEPTLIRALSHGEVSGELHARFLRIGGSVYTRVQEGTELSHPEAGTPRGGVISPLLANIYLHEVLDAWFVRDVQPRLSGPSLLVRYADDRAPRRRGRETVMVN